MRGLNRLRKNVERQANLPKKLTSGAKARVDFMLFMPGLKPRPTARTSFSQPVKPVVFRPFAAVRAKALTYPAAP
jgi:hypothetical protein